jgi:RNA-directed DNA polymerase
VTNGDKNKVKRLQYLPTHSFAAKAYAVKKVTTNKGKNTSGVDKILWSTTASKMKAVLTLTDRGYRAKPLKRVYIAKKGKNKKRPLGIPTMYDRAMQTLYALSPEPITETTADTISFGFRKFHGKLIVKPSKNSVRSVIRKCSDIILRKGKATTQSDLIRRLNQVITAIPEKIATVSYLILMLET